MTEVLGEEGTVKVLMGNEAIARGSIEAGAGLVTGYPGTPSTEVIETLLPVGEKIGMRVEWSVNEKVALEVAAGAALAGMRAMATMKAAGLNVASDPLIQIAYSGVEGGLVIYVADDPAAHAGMAEQDDRMFTKLSSVPMLEPSNPQEAKEMTVAAFDLSQELKTPFLLRGTTRTAHMFGNVKFGPVKKVERDLKFVRDIKRYTKASPAWCMDQHASLLQKLERVSHVATRYGFNELRPADGEGEVGVIASGSAWNYLEDAIYRYGLEDLVTLKVGLINPFPYDLIEKMLSKTHSVLILEELEPFIESCVLELLGKSERRVKVYGKFNKATPRVGEFDQSIVERALERVTGKKLSPPPSLEREEKIKRAKDLVVRRPLTFCAGCPHMATYVSLIRAMKRLGYKRDDVIVTGDIGCTILGMNPPFDLCWTEICMGASIGIAAGFERCGLRKPLIAAIGDSTFYHAGIPSLIDAVWKGTNLTVAILDNEAVAMTGHQPTPGSGQVAPGREAKVIRPEDIARGCGVDHVVVVDPYDLDKATQAFVEAMETEGPSVIVFRRLCSILARRRKLVGKPFEVNLEKCTGCMVCIRTTACPALVPTEGKVKIEPEACIGCGVCAKICPSSAMSSWGGSGG